MDRSTIDDWGRGAEAWPDVGLELAVFQAWRAERPTAAPAFATDHFLACACLTRAPGAIEAFTARYLDQVPRWIGGQARSRDVVDEVRQRLAVRLLVGEDDARGPRLAGYAGEGSLDGWVRVAATRVALHLQRGDRPAQTLADASEQLVDPYDGELVYLRQRYRPHFAQALEGSLAALDSEQRAVLRLHFVEGMTTAALAGLYQMSRATLVRRITDAKTALREAVARELARVLGLSAAEYAELLVSLQSVLDVSLARRLGPVSGA